MGMENFNGGRVEDIEEARKAAKAEKPFRDAAREEGVTPEEKEVLDKVAEEKGEKVISDINREKEMKSFLGRKTINGVEIVVRWDEGYDDYVAYFPQISMDDVSRSMGIFDQLMRIPAEGPDAAKKVFEYACATAEKESDVNKVFKSVEEFSDKLEQK